MVVVIDYCLDVGVGWYGELWRYWWYGWYIDLLSGSEEGEYYGC